MSERIMREVIYTKDEVDALVAAAAEEMRRKAADLFGPCSSCEGSGQVWGDGKAHSQNYKGPTVRCPECGGSGQSIPSRDAILALPIPNAGALERNDAQVAARVLEDAAARFETNYVGSASINQIGVFLRQLSKIVTNRAALGKAEEGKL